jgi:hypothetical protein
MVRSRGAVLSYLFRDFQPKRVSQKRRAAVLSILRGRFWWLKGPHQGPLSAKPRGKSIRRAVFDVRNSTPTVFSQRPGCVELFNWENKCTEHPRFWRADVFSLISQRYSISRLQGGKHSCIVDRLVEKSAKRSGHCEESQVSAYISPSSRRSAAASRAESDPIFLPSRVLLIARIWSAAISAGLPASLMETRDRHPGCN